MISQLEASTDKMTPTQTYHDDEPAWTLQLMIENRAGIVLMLNQKFSNAPVMGTNEDTKTGIKSLTGHSRTDKKKKKHFIILHNSSSL